MEQIKKNNCLKNVTQGFSKENFQCLKKGDSFGFAVDNTTFSQFLDCIFTNIYSKYAIFYKHM